MREITDLEIKKRLAFDNPWWEDGAVPAAFRDWPRRMYFDRFVRLVQQTAVNRAVILMGPRRVGKTVMLTQAVQKLIDDGIAPRRICYVSVDTPTYTGIPLERLLAWFMEIHGHRRGDPLYMIYDEIQYHPDWERHLKSLVDSYPAVRFVASGSAAAALKMKSDESGAGRFTDFLLPPLNFAEFLTFKGITKTKDSVEDALSELSSLGSKRLNDAFVDYVNYGGFPETALKAEAREAMDRFVAQDIVDKVLLRDLPSLYGIQDTQELKRFFTVLAYNTGMEVSFEGLAKASGVAKNTLRKYLDYLEAAFLISRLYRVDLNAKRFRRVTRFKVYLTNPSIRAALFEPVSAADETMGHMAETAVVAHLAVSAAASLYSYARWDKGEVDLVSIDPGRQKPTEAIEIKWSDRAAEDPRNELAGLLSFCRANGLRQAWVYSRSVSAETECAGVRLDFAPISAMCAVTAHVLIEGALERGLDPLALKALLGPPVTPAGG